MSEPAVAEAARVAKPPLGARLRRAFRRRIFEAETLIFMRRECRGELPRGGEAIEQQLVIRRATAADAPVWRESWAAKIDWYLERIATAHELCFIGLVDGRLAVHCWYALGHYFDPVLRYRFECGPGGAYLGEGWVHPDFREHGLATAFNRRLYSEFLPLHGITHVIAYRATDNVASQRLLARFQFVDTHQVRHWRVLGRHRFSKPRALGTVSVRGS